jgi:hypothetical protein
MPKRSFPARSVALALGLALWTALTADPATAALPDDCGASSYTPMLPPPRQMVIAKGDAECTTPRLMQIVVRLQRRMDEVWRNRAIAIGETDQPVTFLAVSARAPCRVGPHRTRVTIRLRMNQSDPWEVALPRFTSPVRVVRYCPT